MASSRENQNLNKRNDLLSTSFETLYAVLLIWQLIRCIDVSLKYDNTL